MGTYNYEALHRHTHGLKRTWSGDPLANGLWGIEPYVPSYANAFPDHFFLAQAAQAPLQALTKGPFFDVPQYHTPAYDPRFVAPLDLMPRSHLTDMAEQNLFTNMQPLSSWNGLDPIQEPMFRRESPITQPMIPEPLILEHESPLSSPFLSPRTPTTPANTEPPLAGMIFGCTSETYMECMQLKLFALPAFNKIQVMRVAPGTKLFLYNYTERELSGVFEATSHGDMNLMPEAFQGYFPAQVCVQCVQRCPNLSLKAFKEAISENFDKQGVKFRYALTDTQVGKLVTLFQQEAKHWRKQKKQKYKRIPFELQPSLLPNYSTHNEAYLFVGLWLLVIYCVVLAHFKLC